MFLCYPVFFLYENPTTGFSKLPLHVWTSARLFDGDHNVEPDIVIRQVWVHGDHMGALHKSVLLEALHVQNLLAPRDARHEVDVGGQDTSQDEGVDLCSEVNANLDTMAFHSPLMFWNCSAKAIEGDADLLDTIYGQSTRRSQLNLTLRPTSVFAGKSFLNDKVIAADALVLTLFGRQTKTASELWDTRIDQLMIESDKRGNLLYPRDGHVHQSRLYEFQQKPLSYFDNFFLIATYTSMALYVFVSLGKLRAVKSWAGLLITVMFEIGLSITASFSLCGLLEIDLARVPDAAYPFVVLVMGLENMFRLINAVLSQKPELPVAQRIATALSEVGHLAMATAGQMLLALWLLAMAAPSIAPFCVFASIALVFDFVFHLTFFLAVLSVDVRRMELSDSLARATNAPPTQKQSIGRQERFYWLDALLQNRLPFSSRIAGSAISICFLLLLNMHFYESSNSLFALYQSVRSMFVSHGDKNVQFIAPPINQARTPAAWLRIQDYRYAQEVLQYVKPSAHSIVARVYDPLVVVLRKADRNSQPLHGDSFFSTAWKLFRQHLYPFVLAVIFSVALVTLLMQYLLWNELPDEEMDNEAAALSIIRVENLPRSHRLDVIHVAACSKGHLVSVSLDKLVTFSTFDQRSHVYSLNSTVATAMSPPIWPVISLAIDESGCWAALCSQGGAVLLWNMMERRIEHTKHIDLNNKRPILFDLLHHASDQEKQARLLVVTPSGQARIISLLSKTEPDVTIDFGHETLSMALISRSSDGVAVVALTKRGKLQIALNKDGKWETCAVDKLDARLSSHSQEGVVKSIYVAPGLHVVAAVRLRVIDLIDIKTRTQIHSFPALLVRGQSLRVLHEPLRNCRKCGAVAVHSISLAYNDFESQSAVLRTYTCGDEDTLICLGPRLAGKHYPCRGLLSAKEHMFAVENPNRWEAINTLLIVGVRMRQTGADTPQSNVSTTSGFEGGQFNLRSFNTPKKRILPDGSAKSGDLLSLNHSVYPPEPDVVNDWEVWTLTVKGEFHVEPLRSSSEQERAHSIGEDELLVAAPGPMARLGHRSVVVGFGNRVKLIMVGKERFEQDATDYQDLAHQANARRRRPASKK